MRRIVLWHKKQEMGKFAFSVAGIALAGFRHRFMHDYIHLPETQDERDYERNAYYNGRVEALWCGRIADNRYYPSPIQREKPSLFDPRPTRVFYMLDSRSFYGAVEQFCSVPIKCVRRCNDYQDSKLPEGVDPYDCIADVTITTPVESYPVRHLGRTIYGTGTFRTVLCGPELSRAVSTHAVSRIHSFRHYETTPALRWYSEGVYAERLRADSDGDGVISALTKALIARLHGKFMQRATRWVDCPKKYAQRPWWRWFATNIKTGESQLYRSLGWSVQRQEDAGDAPHCFPAIAAWVTANGREWLRSWVQKAGRHNTLYVSTDSLIVTEDGLANLTKAGIVGGDHIGALRVVDQTDNIEIRGPNNLSFGDRHIISGLPMLDLAVAGGTASYSVQGGLEEAFNAPDQPRVRCTTVEMALGKYTHPGKVDQGGWTIPAVLTLKEQSDAIDQYVPETIAPPAVLLAGKY
jgi:hypothetical protein